MTESTDRMEDALRAIKRLLETWPEPRTALEADEVLVRVDEIVKEGLRG